MILTNLTPPRYSTGNRAVFQSHEAAIHAMVNIYYISMSSISLTDIKKKKKQTLLLSFVWRGRGRDLTSCMWCMFPQNLITNIRLDFKHFNYMIDRLTLQNSEGKEALQIFTRQCTTVVPMAKLLNPMN